MSANNLRIVYDNIVDYVSSTVSASSTASSTSIVSNLRSDTRSLVWRSGTHTTLSIPAVFKNVASVATTGVHSNIAVTCTASSGNPTLYYTFTPNGGTETANTTVLSTFTTAILDNAGRTNYVLRVYSGTTTAASTLVDQQTVPVILSSAGSVTVLLTNQWHRLPGATTATVSMANSRTTLIVYDGTTPLRYDGVGTNAGTYTIAAVGTGVTAGPISSGTNNSNAFIGDHSAPVANTSTVVYTVTGRTLGNGVISTTTTQTLVVSGVADSINYVTNFDSTLSRAVLGIGNIPTSAPSIGMVGLTYTNLNPGATMRVLGYNASVSLSGTVDLPHFLSSTTRAFDTGPIICCPFQSTRQPSWTQNVFGTVTYGLDRQLVRAYIPPGIQAPCTTLVVEITDFQNSDNFIEASRLIAGRYWSPVYNTEYGLSVGLKDESETVRSESGDLITTNGVVYKTLNFDLNHLVISDRNELVRILRENGKRKALFISLFPENVLDFEQESLYQLYGKLSSGSDITHPYYQYFSSSIQLEEV